MWVSLSYCVAGWRKAACGVMPLCADGGGVASVAAMSRGVTPKQILHLRRAAAAADKRSQGTRQQGPTWGHSVPRVQEQPFRVRLHGGMGAKGGRG